ncbi:MAG: hypothetical protein NT098_00510 [Candidatus Parcubacteria bacterium]|nr:hypothetical protein [Candidatus Parcubacteria bacterium]
MEKQDIHQFFIYRVTKIVTNIVNTVAKGIKSPIPNVTRIKKKNKIIANPIPNINPSKILYCLWRARLMARPIIRRVRTARIPRIMSLPKLLFKNLPNDGIKVSKPEKNQIRVTTEGRINDLVNVKCFNCNFIRFVIYQLDNNLRMSA